MNMPVRHYVLNKWTLMVLALFVATTSAVFLSRSGADAKTHENLDHVGSFFLTENSTLAGLPPTDPTSAEIVDVTPDGKTMVYTDSFTSALGFVDISDRSNPKPDGLLFLPGDPTSVAFHKKWVLTAVVTSNDFDNPAGALLVIDIKTRSIIRTIDLGGQPDAIAISPNGGRYAAIAIENERDEDENDGIIPQSPAGFLQIINLAGQPNRWSMRSVDLTGLADVAPSDPEPEFVDINGKNKAVISLQENNHLVIVDLRTARVINHFSAGSTDVFGIDNTEEELGPQGTGLIELVEDITSKRREPDTVAWIDNERFATANEGDYEDENGEEGGSRSFTIFNVDGTVEFEAGNSFEYEVVRAGHYPESRSENKGVEPEGLEVGRYKNSTYLFVASERANIIGVYDVTGSTPVLKQMLPTGIGPEGLKLTHDGTLVVTAEEDGFAEGYSVRSIITLFKFGGNSDWSYPQLVSDDENGAPIPWVAISGLSGDLSDADTVWAVSDSFLAQSWLYQIDVSSKPAVIVDRIAIGTADGSFDLEGVAARPGGGFWLASEGRNGARPNAIIRTDASGAIQQSVELPGALVLNATNSGFEGVAVAGTPGVDEVVYVVVQREWADDAPGEVKVGKYDVIAEEWSFATYELDAVESPAGGWVGLSEVTLLPDDTLAIVERDNQLGQEAHIKRVYGIDPASVTFAPYGDPPPIISKTLLRDVFADLDAASISVPDKLEGLAVTLDGKVLLATDNDGVDENYGETLFLELGAVDSVFTD